LPEVTILAAAGTSLAVCASLVYAESRSARMSSKDHCPRPRFAGKTSIIHPARRRLENAQDLNAANFFRSIRGDMMGRNGSEYLAARLVASGRYPRSPFVHDIRVSAVFERVPNSASLRAMRRRLSRTMPKSRHGFTSRPDLVSRSITKPPAK